MCGGIRRKRDLRPFRINILQRTKRLILVNIIPLIRRHFITLTIVLTTSNHSGRLWRMAKEWTASKMGRVGGKARAARYSKRQFKAWGRLGGKPAKITGIAREGLETLLASRRPHAEIAEIFGISLRTVGRYLRQLRERESVE